VHVEWEPRKAEENLRKHGVSFDEAQVLFESDDYLEIFDDDHSADEDRFIAIGPIRRGVVLVVFTERTDDTVRVISARWANKRERELYRRYMEGRR
jgi:uncharacterized DUF497 family protein